MGGNGSKIVCIKTTMAHRRMAGHGKRKRVIVSGDGWCVGGHGKIILGPFTYPLADGGGEVQVMIM